MTPGQIKRPPSMINKGESAGVTLYLDVGWTKTDNGFFKGYKTGLRKGNYTEITMNSCPPNVIVLIGPTASGKTELAIEIAEYFKTRIHNID